jgi:hypothetical protein
MNPSFLFLFSVVYDIEKELIWHIGYILFTPN